MRCHAVGEGVALEVVGWVEECEVVEEDGDAVEDVCVFFES